MSISNCRQCANWKGAGCPTNPLYGCAYLNWEKASSQFQQDISAALTPCTKYAVPPKIQITLTLSSIDWKQLHQDGKLQNENRKELTRQIGEALRWTHPDSFDDDVPF